MKKTLFAIEVFGLIAMFPLYAVVELNHKRSTSTANDTRLIVIEERIKQNIPSVINSKEEHENDVFFIGQKILLLK
jgi:hypothetical protein